ncbi:site-2 protease family protein [Actinoplanes sp. L3-i22]|uniref:site-2 protease family protein n=1 Tax=Actinoplanes sp. L3-i22 TaxID=2836373 RepID=UPI001C77A591|nr:site-2 protease family protein [Actinoplanes sp. L3-i22]BCY09436.1 putative zinc metalloprotease Rip3 [Actinoplanes sp. L3-i22]
MRQTVRLGTIRGIPVGAHWSVLVVLLLVADSLAVGLLPAGAAGYPAVAYWLTAAWTTVLFMAALLGHELAHALVAQHYRISVQSITLWALGGVSTLDDKARHPRAELFIALAGPAASLVAAGLFAALTYPAGLMSSRLPQLGFTWLAGANLVLAIFNLLPGVPLDGGRILTAILWWARGDRAAARRVATRAGTALGILLTGLGLALVFGYATPSGLWLVVLGWYLGLAARREQAGAELSEKLRGVTVSQAMSTPAVCGYAGQTVTAFVARTAQWCPHQVYPVTDLDGRLAGLVTVGALVAVPPERRACTRLAQLMIPAGRLPVVQPSEPLLGVLNGLDNPLRTLVVVDQERPCGVLTSGDVGRVVGVVRLGGAPAAHDVGARP